MPSGHSGETTKRALADALLLILRAGTPLRRISIRSITALCGLDRQTFYYHFKNIYELAEYTYDRELSKLFGIESIEDLDTVDWHMRMEKTLSVVEQNPALRDSLIPALGESSLRSYLDETFQDALKREVVPTLVAGGVSNAEAGRDVKLLSCSITAILLAWITHDIECSATEIISDTTRIIEDCIEGAIARVNA